ncbi:MAG: hypothetical protein K2X35_22115 [Bryobacteraceae bacterium]|nr:hypothetical protein [Bryobacteraceae bacterium]
MRKTTFAVILLGAVEAFGQAPKPKPAAAPPDLSGTYDIATLTPLVRPARLGDRLELSPDEARAIEKQEAARMAANSRSSDPNRAAPPKGGDGSEGAAGNVGGYNTVWTDRGSGAFQINGKYRTSIVTDPKNGQLPPMTPAAMKAARERVRFNRQNTGEAWWVAEGLNPGPFDDPELRGLAERCLLGFGSSAGPPALPVLYNNVKRIVQTKDTVIILNEMVHDARIIRINGKHEPPEIRRWLGDSIGRWEGDTLVVDTTNFTDRSGLFNATRNLHVVERFSRIDAKTLRYQFTVEDPTVWTAPWSGEMIWPATDQRIYEYACHEGNYSFAGILRGARVLEAEAEAKKASEKK